MAVIPGEYIRRAALHTPTIARPPAGPAARLANGANNIRDVTSQSGGYGGYQYNPDPGLIQGYVNAQPGVTQAYGNMTFGDNAQSAITRKAVQDALIGYGDPNMIRQQFGGAVDPATAGLAQQATASGGSVLAGLRHDALAQHQGDMANLLAGGGIHTGATLWDMNNESYLASQAGSKALSTLQGQLQGYNQTDLDARTTNANNYATALQTGFTNVLNHPDQYQLPGPGHVDVGAAPKATPWGAGQNPNPPGGPYLGSSYPKGSYTNVGGSGAPSYTHAAAPTIKVNPIYQAPGGPYRGSSLGPGSYQNTTGAGAPSYARPAAPPGAASPGGPY